MWLRKQFAQSEIVKGDTYLSRGTEHDQGILQRIFKRKITNSDYNSLYQINSVFNFLQLLIRDIDKYPKEELFINALRLQQRQYSNLSSLNFVFFDIDKENDLVSDLGNTYSIKEKSKVQQLLNFGKGQFSFKISDTIVIQQIIDEQQVAVRSLSTFIKDSISGAVDKRSLRSVIELLSATSRKYALLMALNRSDHDDSIMIGIELPKISARLRTIVQQMVVNIYNTIEIHEKTIIESDLHQQISDISSVLTDTEKMTGIGHWQQRFKYRDGQIIRGELKWSPMIYQIFNVNAQEFSGDFNKVIDSRIHPDDRYEIRKVFENVINYDSLDMNYRVILPNGDQRVVNVSFKTNYSNDRSEITLRGTIRDVTESEKLKLDLAERSKEMQGIIQLSRLIKADKALSELTIKRFLSEVVPASMKYPEKVFAVLEIRGIYYGDVAEQTTNYLSSDIVADDQIIGQLKIGYIDESLQFVANYEQQLIDNYAMIIGNQLGLINDFQVERKQNHLLSTFFNSIPHHIWFKDLQGRFIKVNRAMALDHAFESEDQMYGYSDEQLFGNDIEHQQRSRQEEQQIIQTRIPIIETTEKKIDQDGHTYWTATSKFPLFDSQGELIGTYGMSRDITEHILKELEVNIQNDITELISRSQNVREVSLGIVKVLGMIERVDAVQVFLFNNRSQLFELVSATNSLNAGNDYFSLEEVFEKIKLNQSDIKIIDIDKESSKISFFNYSAADLDNLKQLMLIPISYRDQIIAIVNLASYSGFDDQSKKITERIFPRMIKAYTLKQMMYDQEINEIKMRQLLNAFEDNIILLNRDGYIEDINQSAANILNGQVNKLRGKLFYSMVDDPAAQQRMKELLNKIVVNKQSLHFTESRLDGTIFYTTFYPILNNDGGLIYIAAMSHDVTDIHKAMEDKQMLIKEIYHRVKNNFMMLSSLMSLKAMKIVDERDNLIMEEIKQQMDSMVKVNEMLYKSQRIDEGVNIKEFLDEFVPSIHHAQDNMQNVRLDIITQDVTLNPQKAIPLTLVVNEILTNSFKYAFPDGRKGIIKLELLNNNDGTATLTMSDDGIGVPEGLRAQLISCFKIL